MMSEYSDCFLWTCDSCGLEAEFARGGAGSMYDAVAELRARGWLISRMAGGWSHYCSERQAVAKRGQRSLPQRRLSCSIDRCEV
jgi:hypothetical protein